MKHRKRILLAGESWTVHSIHQKGFDNFTTTEYAEGGGWLIEALRKGGFEVEYQPSHVANRAFPSTTRDLRKFDCVVLSDIGTNTLLLHPDTFVRSISLPNRLVSIRDYVRGGGGLVMVGGYMTFQGIDAKARYHGTPVEEALPVEISPDDDRVESPEGLTPRVVLPGHPIVAGLGRKWPDLLGLSNIRAKAGAELVATAGGYPLIVAGSYGRGRSVAFASDCGPHWAPPAFIEWPGYARLWRQIVGWASQ
jgi:uncharacterized membrane protein